MHEYTVPLRNSCHKANHVFHTSFCLCCGSLSFKIIFSAALELVIIHRAMNPDLMKTKSNFIGFVQWNQVCSMLVLLLTR